METLELLLQGLAAALRPELLLAALVGALAGTIAGILPGVGPVAGAAIVLPITFAFDPAVGLIMIAGIYLGAQYGGSTTSVLLNIPGEASAIVATFDGHQMAKKGRAGAALTIMALGSFIAGLVALLIMAFTANWITGFALNFGALEFFALTAGGLVILARITGGSLGGGLLPMVLGVGLGTVGLDVTSATNRFTFGNLDLSLGLELATVAVGLYGLSEILLMLEGDAAYRRPLAVRLRELLPTREELRRSLTPWARGSVLGFVFGLLPVPSATLSTFASYRLEKAVSKHRKEIGTGAVEGIAGPEAANNSAAIGSMVPILLLGLPFSAVLALMLSAMIVHGIQPGPLFMSQHPDLFWSVMGAVIIANVMLLVLNLPLVGVWVQVLKTPQHYLVPLIVILAAIGAFSIHNNMIDVQIMVVVGVVGYILRKLHFSLASLLVGLVLGPLIEKYFLRSVFLSQGDMGYFLSSPIANTIWVSVAVVIVGGALLGLLRRSKRRMNLTEAADM